MQNYNACLHTQCLWVGDDRLLIQPTIYTCVCCGNVHAVACIAQTKLISLPFLQPTHAHRVPSSHIPPVRRAEITVCQLHIHHSVGHGL
jgi:hypothetical protein